MGQRRFWMTPNKKHKSPSQITLTRVCTRNVNGIQIFPYTVKEFPHKYQ